MTCFSVVERTNLKECESTAVLPLLVIACASAAPPELGDPKYVDAQRACLAVNIDNVGILLLEGDRPDESQVEDIIRKCKDLGYEWVGTTDSLAQRTDDLRSP